MPERKLGRDLADFAWYSLESKRLGLPPRCPFASLDLCPKYYESIVILGRAGKITDLPPEQAERLEEKWSGSLAVLAEQSPGYMSSDDRVRSISNICPEVGFDTFGHFASGFFDYADELDSGLAHEQLARIKAPRDDPRWGWAHITPEHYTECRQYSLLSAAPVVEVSQLVRGPGRLVRYGQSPSIWERYGKEITVGIIVTVVGGLILALLSR